MDIIKQLTGKNPNDFERAAAFIIDNADEKSFEELISKDDFLFDFIKQNVANRLQKACNQNNFKNLLKFLKYYSLSYEEFIAKTLTNFADNELDNIMLEMLQSGSDNEKTYCAKYFSYRKNESATDILRQYAYNEFEPLALNSAIALSTLNDKISVENAFIKLQTTDDFEVLSAVKFLSAFNEKSAIPEILKIMKTSSVAEYIACEIGYMVSFLELLKTNYEDALACINYILQGLGEIIPLSQVFTFQLYEFFEQLLNSEPNSKNAVILLFAQNKFNQLTENDEYLFDEDKNTKDEVNAIKQLLNDNLDDDLIMFTPPELNENSPLVYCAIDLQTNSQTLKPLLNSSNQTIILKTLELIKTLGDLTQTDKDIALKRVSDENIKAIILAL